MFPFPFQFCLKIIPEEPGAGTASRAAIELQAEQPPGKLGLGKEEVKTKNLLDFSHGPLLEPRARLQLDRLFSDDLNFRTIQFAMVRDLLAR